MTKSILRPLAAVVLAASLAGGALAQAPASADEAIVVQVRDAIDRAPSLAGADIKVETHEGVVTLSGFARTMKDIAAAEALARGVRGVKAVKNGIRVAPRPSRA